MKQRINISIDEENIKKLQQESNYSDIINQQITRYYNEKSLESIEILKKNIAKIKEESKILHRNRREMEKKLKKLKEKEDQVLEKYKSKDKIIEEVKRRRTLCDNDPYKKITFFTTVEEDAERILKGGRLPY